MRTSATLMLADGSIFKGVSIGKKGSVGGEICFNTGMTGYQEIYTDPSYLGQIVINTNAHIGNYGVLSTENESESVKISGVIIKNFSDVYSRKMAEGSLQNYLESAGIVGIADIDTRKLVAHIREKGAMNALITSETDDIDIIKESLASVPDMNGLELSSRVSTKEPYFVGNEDATYRVAVLDIGVKRNILRNFEKRDCLCKVFPAKTSYEEMLAFQPHGFFISNGPGDPAAMDYAVETVKQIVENDHPVFGICLGHQLLARACGIGTYKMHHGHRGLNHPVKNLKTGKGEITSQNHGFAVSTEDVEKHPEVELTHIHLNDNSVAGIRLKNRKAFSVQYHPEASPGPHDSAYLFDDFIELLG